MSQESLYLVEVHPESRVQHRIVCDEIRSVELERANDNWNLEVTLSGGRVISTLIGSREFAMAICDDLTNSLRRPSCTWTWNEADNVKHGTTIWVRTTGRP